jgi:two-component system, NarL family, sensor kinase
MDAIQSEGRQRKLRDLIEAMRRLGVSGRLGEPQVGLVADADGAALAILSSDGSFLCVNRRLAALLGYPAAELVGRKLVDMAPEDERAPLTANLSAHSARDFHSFNAVLCGRTGRPIRLACHQQAVSMRQDDRGVCLTLFEEAPAPEAAPASSVQSSAADARCRETYRMLGQRAERQRVAADLHDGLGQAITLIKLMIEDALMRLRRGQADAAAHLLDATVLQVRATIGELRLICEELRPPALERLGLPAALRSLCRRVGYSAGGPVVSFQCDVDNAVVPDHLKADIFRVAQEALNNIVRHAAATEIRLTLHRSGTGLRLAVQDNGAGYDTRPLSSENLGSTGLGLAGLQHRVESQGGLFSIESSGRNGTIVSATWVL